MSQEETVGELEQSVGYVLKQAQAALHTAMDAVLRPMELTVAQYACLELLGQYPGGSNSELARGAFVTRQSMNLVLRGLQDRGLLTRPEQAPHGRALPTQLTSDGQKSCTPPAWPCGPSNGKCSLRCPRKNNVGCATTLPSVLPPFPPAKAKSDSPAIASIRRGTPPARYRDSRYLQLIPHDAPDNHLRTRADAEFSRRGVRRIGVNQPGNGSRAASQVCGTPTSGPRRGPVPV